MQQLSCTLYILIKSISKESFIFEVVFAVAKDKILYINAQTQCCFTIWGKMCENPLKHKLYLLQCLLIFSRFKDYLKYDFLIKIKSIFNQIWRVEVKSYLIWFDF